MMKKHLLYILPIIIFTAFTACEKKNKTVYELEQFNADPPGAGKLKEKTDEQYISVLYANLFQKAISVSRLKNIGYAIYSVGDKQLAYEMVVSDFMRDPTIIFPNDTVIDLQPETFLSETYKRFYVRFPSEAERRFFENYFRDNQGVKVEHVYAAFALSNEYKFY